MQIIQIFPTFSPTVPKNKAHFLLKTKTNNFPLGKMLFQKLVKRTMSEKAWTHQNKKKGSVRSNIEGFFSSGAPSSVVSFA